MKRVNLQVEGVNLQVEALSTSRLKASTSRLKRVNLQVERVNLQVERVNLQVERLSPRGERLGPPAQRLGSMDVSFLATAQAGRLQSPPVKQLPDALAALRGRAPEMPALTREWVLVNSFTENVAGVNAVGQLLREALALPSLTCEVRRSERFGDHLIWRTPAALDPEARPILLIGHHDTVFPPGHFEGWREEDGRAIGPGALDMKGGLAVVRTALAALDDVGELARLPLVVVTVADEEVGSPRLAPSPPGAGAQRRLRPRVRVRTRRRLRRHPAARHRGHDHGLRGPGRATRATTIATA